LSRIRIPADELGQAKSDLLGRSTKLGHALVVDELRVPSLRRKQIECPKVGRIGSSHGPVGEDQSNPVGRD
jgi:hypothetical protein